MEHAGPVYRVCKFPGEAALSETESPRPRETRPPAYESSHGSEWAIPPPGPWPSRRTPTIGAISHEDTAALWCGRVPQGPQDRPARLRATSISGVYFSRDGAYAP